MAKAAPKQRIDDYLLSHGYFNDLKQARAWIMAGKIVVDGAVCSHAGALVRDPEVVIRGATLRFASRGGYKLEKALHAFRPAIQDKVVLDAGAASGGFTDCLLQHGARLVYAVDVGYGQMKGRLAADPRVRNMERVNISDVEPGQLNPPIDWCVGDLSFLSLVTGIPILRALFGEGHPARLVVLVKPLFEGLMPEHRSDPTALEPVLLAFFERLTAAGIPLTDVTVSPILGSRETVEFLFLSDESLPSVAAAEMTARAIQSLAQDPPSTVLPDEVAS